jgi:hypothetical protein
MDEKNEPLSPTDGLDKKLKNECKIVSIIIYYFFVINLFSLGR